MSNDKPRFEREIARVKDVFDLQMGKTPSRDNSEYWNNGDYDWVSVKDLGSYKKYVGATKETISERGVRESKIKSVPANTLIMSFKLSIGKTAITVKETFTNEAIMAFLDKGTYPVDPVYMFHQFRSIDWTAGSNIAVMGKTLNKKTLGASLIRVPRISEQKRVADMMDYVNDLIDLAELRLSKLQDLVKSRFVEMFGDAQVGYKFRLKKLGSLLSVKPQNGLYKPQEYYSETGGVPIVRVDAFQSGYIEDFRSLRRLRCTDDEVATYGLHDGDIVINRVNGSIERVGKIAWIRELVEPTVFESNMMRFHIDESTLNLAYVTAFLNSSDIREQIKSCARIANQCSINQSNVVNFDIPAPPLSLQQEFAAFVAQVDKSEFAVRQSIEKLQTLYDSLAQEYFG